MTRSQKFLISLIFFLTCASPTAFAGYLTLYIEGKSDSGPFIFSITPQDIQSDKAKQIPLNKVGKTQTFHNTGVDLSLNIERPGDLFSIKPIFDLTVTGFKLTRVDFDIYKDNDPNDEIPGFEIPIKVHFYDKKLFALDTLNPLILKFTALDPDNIENANAMFVFREVPEPSSLLLILLGCSLLGLKLYFKKV